MYRVKSDAIELVISTRRRAFSEAFRLARANGHAALYDGLLIEPPIWFDLDGAAVKLCHCTAEARLLRAIFAETHPVACSGANV